MQKLITGNSLFDWERRVNDALQDGWRVVPGTLKMELACSSATPANSVACYTNTDHFQVESYAVVVEGNQ